MLEGEVPARVGRDIVLIDEVRHPMWLPTGNALAEQMGSAGCNVVPVREPDRRWFEENGYAQPSREQLAAFVADGIVFLPALEQDFVLPYSTKSFASEAINACLDNAMVRHAGRKVSLCQLGSSEAELAEQRRLATLVLDDLEALSAEDFAARCEVAFMNKSIHRSVGRVFEELRTAHRATWLRQLNEIWQQRRAELCRTTAVDHT